MQIEYSDFYGHDVCVDTGGRNAPLLFLMRMLSFSWALWVESQRRKFITFAIFVKASLHECLILISAQVSIFRAAASVSLLLSRNINPQIYEDSRRYSRLPTQRALRFHDTGINIKQLGTEKFEQ